MDSTETIRIVREELAEIEKILDWMDKSKEIHQLDIDLLLNKTRLLYDRFINMPAGRIQLLIEEPESIVSETVTATEAPPASPAQPPASPEPKPEPAADEKPEPYTMELPETMWDLDIVPESVPDQEPEQEPEPEPEPAPEPEPEPEPEPAPEPEPEPVPMPEPEPIWVPKANPVREQVPFNIPYQPPVPRQERPPVREPMREPVRETVTEINLFQREGSLNEALGKQKPVHDIASSITEVPVSDIWSAITINERFLFIRELFGNDAERFKNTVTLLNSLSSWDAAKKFMTDRYEWDKTNQIATDFLNVVRRRFLK